MAKLHEPSRHLKLGASKRMQTQGNSYTEVPFEELGGISRRQGARSVARSFSEQLCRWPSWTPSPSIGSAGPYQYVHSSSVTPHVANAVPCRIPPPNPNAPVIGLSAVVYLEVVHTVLDKFAFAFTIITLPLGLGLTFPTAGLRSCRRRCHCCSCHMCWFHSCWKTYRGRSRRRPAKMMHLRSASSPLPDVLSPQL